MPSPPEPPNDDNRSVGKLQYPIECYLSPRQFLSLTTAGPAYALPRVRSLSKASDGRPNESCSRIQLKKATKLESDSGIHGERLDSQSLPQEDPHTLPAQEELLTTRVEEYCDMLFSSKFISCHQRSATKEYKDERCYLLGLPFEIRTMILRKLLVREDCVIQSMSPGDRGSDLGYGFILEYDSSSNGEKTWFRPHKSEGGPIYKVENPDRLGINFAQGTHAFFPKSPASLITSHPLPTALSSAILRTCKQLHYEGSCLLYGANVFRFDSLCTPGTRSWDFLRKDTDVLGRVGYGYSLGTETRDLLTGFFNYSKHQPFCISGDSIMRFIHQIGRRNARRIRTIKYSVIIDWPWEGWVVPLDHHMTLFRHTLPGLRTLKLTISDDIRKTLIFGPDSRIEWFSHGDLAGIFAEGGPKLFHSLIAIMSIVGDFPLLQQLEIYGVQDTWDLQGLHNMIYGRFYDRTRAAYVRQAFMTPGNNTMITVDDRTVKKALKKILKMEIEGQL